MAQLTKEDLLERVGMAAPTTEAETHAILDRAIDVVLGKEGGSGYRDVYKGASAVNPWQAKPYLRPGVQRNLGSFPTPEAAAREVIIWMYGGRPTPPTPTKERNKRGVGRRVRDRSNKGKGAPAPNRLHPLPFSQCSALGAGGVDLRTSEHRPKKAKRALQARTPEPAAPAVPLVAQVLRVSTGGGSAAAATPIQVWVDGVEHTTTT